MMQMTLDAHLRRRRDDRPSIGERYREFLRTNPHVFDAALSLAREWLGRGDKYISTKAILEVLRTSIATSGEGGYRVNNDFSSLLARDLISSEPRLADVIRLRRRKAA